MLTKGDKWLVMVLLSIALAGVGLHMYYIAANGQGQTVIITVNGQTVKTFPLRQGYVGEFRLGDDHGYNIIEYSGGRVRVREADCPDQICVNSGWISMSPQQIVCLPYRVVVKVVAGVPADVDDIAR
ncbi:NusG domain II-containing protein [Sporomusa termitida]|uniref:NusG domain II n=1 Tax=Sporomusa termitida TaxID=2377 RepID=A0A517DS42_9FIRM|nr:NusG domain II-containing protein [Sporomusa termitida]QDR80116.1 NusG domain II [Sporomusa termitida]